MVECSARRVYPDHALKARVLITETIHDDARALLAGAGWTLVDGNGAGQGPFAALLVRTRVVTPDMLQGVSLVAKHGVGVDNIPLAACRAAGVAVMNTPGANSGAVAEHALMLMLALARDLDGLRQSARAPQVAGLQGRRLLVVGYGASGRRVAALGAAFGMKITVVSRSLTGNDTAEGHAIAHDLGVALTQADVLSLHCPLTDATRHMIDATALAAMPHGALVINCARGGLIDEAALAASLAAGHLGGAGLDVTETEPLPVQHPLRQAPRLILTPHAAAMSAGAFRQMGMDAAQNILDHFAGTPRPEAVVVAIASP